MGRSVIATRNALWPGKFTRSGPAASLAESLETGWLPDTEAAETRRVETLRYRSEPSYAP
jgi:hypothetical protein